MKILEIYPVHEKEKDQNKAFKGKAPSVKDADSIYSGNDDVTLFDIRTGKRILILKRGAIEINSLHNTVDRIDGVGGKVGTSNRKTSSGGAKNYRKTRQDGSKSKTTTTKHSYSSTIMGFFDRYPRINYCRACAFNMANPLVWQAGMPLFEEVDSIYKELAQSEYLAHRKFADKVNKDFRIGETVFTTITYNKNYRTFYHRDNGNTDSGFSAMLYRIKGKVEGGHLILPNYRFGVHLRNNDLILFKGTEYHGNTKVAFPFRLSERITMVFYTRRKMIFCGTKEQELERAKRVPLHGGSTRENLNQTS